MWNDLLPQKSNHVNWSADVKLTKTLAKRTKNKEFSENKDQFDALRVSKSYNRIANFFLLSYSQTSNANIDIVNILHKLIVLIQWKGISCLHLAQLRHILNS